MSLPSLHDELPATPRYELRARRRAASDRELEVWQLPTNASPHLRRPRRIAGLHGRNLALVEHRLLRRFGHRGIDPSAFAAGNGKKSFELDEELALQLGLLFRALAPMRSRSRMVSCAEGIEAMGREEAAYWLGMAMHRKYPRRVLQALRYLLIDPKRR